MRTETIGEITVTYPDNVVAAFARNPVTVDGFTGTHVLMNVKNSANGMACDDKRTPLGGELFFDIAYYMQVMFDQSIIGRVDYDSAVSGSGMADDYIVSLEFYNGSVKTGSMSFEVLGVWASNMPSDEQILTRFVGYPFTVSLFVPFMGTVSIGDDSYAAPSKACNVVIPDSSDDVEVTADGQSVKVVADNGCSGVYLRWVDSCGRYCYWLFKKGNITSKIANTGEFKRKNTGTDMGGRRTAKTVTPSVEVCAPLVDADTFMFLLGCAASPVVDMYDDGGWLSVEVEAGDIVRERETLQDFIMKIVLPESNLQKL